MITVTEDGPPDPEIYRYAQFEITGPILRSASGEPSISPPPPPSRAAPPPPQGIPAGPLIAMLRDVVHQEQSHILVAAHPLAQFSDERIDVSAEGDELIDEITWKESSGKANVTKLRFHPYPSDPNTVDYITIKVDESAEVKYPAFR